MMYESINQELISVLLPKKNWFLKGWTIKEFTNNRKHIHRTVEDHVMESAPKRQNQYEELDIKSKNDKI